MLGVEVVFLELYAVDKYASVAHLDILAGHADDPLDVALVGVVGEPEYDDIAALDVAPTDTLYLVIDQLINEQPLAVVQLRQHRGALDHHGLDKENAEQDKHDDDQKDIAEQPESLGPNALARLAAEADDIDVAIVPRIDGPEWVFIFAAELKHIG